MKSRAAIYLRVSTDEQTVENQLIDLEKLADLRKWTVIEVYRDEGISGTKGKKDRPGLKRLLQDARKRRFDIVLFWSVDRLGRSTAQVTAVMEELDNVGIRQYYFKESMDTTTAHGQAMLEMSAVFAKLERKMIRERVIAGLERAKKNGKTLGRPKIPDAIKQQVLVAHQDGLSMRKVADKVGLSIGKVHGIIKEVA